MQSVLLNSYVSLALPNFPNRSSINPSQFTALGFLHDSPSHSQFSDKFHQYKLQARKPGFILVNKNSFAVREGVPSLSQKKKIPMNTSPAPISPLLRLTHQLQLCDEMRLLYGKCHTVLLRRTSASYNRTSPCFREHTYI